MTLRSWPFSGSATRTRVVLEPMSMAAQSMFTIFPDATDEPGIATCLITDPSQRLDREFTICRDFRPSLSAMHVLPTVLPSLRRTRRGSSGGRLDPEALG